MIPGGFRGKLLLGAPCHFKEYLNGERDKYKIFVFGKVRAQSAEARKAEPGESIYPA